MRSKALTAVLSATAIAVPVANAAAAPKKKVVTVTRSVSGPQVPAHDWGYVEVTLVVKKTTTTVGTKKKVTRKITAVRVPIYPNHTNRSLFINQQALPMLVQETLSAQFTGGVNMISGASNTSDAFVQSLQYALTAASKV